MDIAVRPDVSETNLRRLLSVGLESPTLDYKSACDPSNTDELLEIVKDVAAMQVDGGYLVIGADDHGKPTGSVTESQLKQFEQASFRAKMRKYLPEPLDLLVKTHCIDGHDLIMVYVGPSTSVFAIIARDGNNSRGRTVFQPGDVFARHGTASERWNQHDIAKIKHRLVQNERERWLREATMAITANMTTPQASAVANEPVGTLSWELDTETFRGAVLELLSRGQVIPLKYLLSNVRAEVGGFLLDPSGRERLEVVLDRLTCLACLTLQLDESAIFRLTLQGLVDTYRLPIDSEGSRKRQLSVPAAQLWFMVLQRVCAVGALATRLRRWPEVRALVAQRGRGTDFDKGFSSNWYRHALVMASRDNLLKSDQSRRDESLLTFALRQVERLPCLRPDMTIIEEEEVLTSLVQFDFLACVVAIDIAAGSPDKSPFFPSFARFYSSRVQKIAADLISDESLRKSIANRTDAEIANVLDGIGKASSQQILQWGGYDSDTDAFIARNLPPE